LLLPDPPYNITNLNLEATILQVIVPRPLIPPPPPKKPSKGKVFPPVLLPGFTRVDGKVNSYSTYFLTYESIVEFLESIKFYHVNCSDVMIVKFCSKRKRVFMCATSKETPFMYMYLDIFNLHLNVAFDKFKFDVLKELIVDHTQLHLNVWTTMCAFRVLCHNFSNIATVPKFLHHYSVKENKNGGCDMNPHGTRADLGSSRIKP